MIVQSVYPCQMQRVSTLQRKTFKGAGSEVISEGFKEFVSEGLPFYKAARTLYKAGEGDTKGAIKQGIGAIDNVVLQPVKQAAAAAVAAKGAAIGTAICPGLGTAIGCGIGYLGTLLFWGKARNTIVDEIMD